MEANARVVLVRKLARRDLRLPFAVGALAYAVNLLAVWLIVPETCEPADRKPFTARGSSPLTFLQVCVLMLAFKSCAAVTASEHTLGKCNVLWIG